MQVEHELLTGIYAAFNRRDIDSVLAALAPDVDWPNGWEGGRLVGHQAVREYWMRQWAEIDPLVEPVGFASDAAGRITVQVHQRVRDLQQNVLSDSLVVHAYEFENGQIKRMDISDAAEGG